MRGPGGGVEAILYSRPDCPLCFALRRAAKRGARRHGLALRVVEVGADPVLEARYGRDVPVLVLPGGRTIRGRARYDEVERAFREAASLAGEAHLRRPGGGRPWLRRLVPRFLRGRFGA